MVDPPTTIPPPPPLVPSASIVEEEVEKSPPPPPSSAPLTVPHSPSTISQEVAIKVGEQSTFDPITTQPHSPAIDPIADMIYFLDLESY